MTIKVDDIKDGPFKPDTVSIGYIIQYSFNLSNKSWDGSFFDAADSRTEYVFDDATSKPLNNQNYFQAALQQWRNYTVFSFAEDNTNPEFIIYAAETNENVPTPNDGGNKDGATFPTIFNGGQYTKVEVVLDDDLNLASVPGYFASLHEIGHVLGLGGDGALDLEYTTDITVMSYNVPNGRYAVTPMALDILAVEQMYGPESYDPKDTYSFVANSPYVTDFIGLNRSKTIMDTGGENVFDLSGYSGGGVTLDLRKSIDSAGNWQEGHHSIVGDEYIYIAHNTDIKSAIGTNKNDIFRGVEGKVNSFDGRDGIDTLDYSHYSSSIDVDLSAGSDSEGNSITSIEKVILGAAGGTVLGSGGNDYIEGFLGDDILRGGQGSDFISAGAGQDVLSSDYSSAITNNIFDGGDGVDWLEFDGSYDLRLEAGVIAGQNVIATNIEAVRFTDVDGDAVITIGQLGNSFDINNMSETPWLNYGGVGESLHVDLSGVNWVVETTTQLSTETFANIASAAFHYAGTDHGDTVTLGSNSAQIWLGDDDDTVTATSSSGQQTLYYKGGEDVVENAYYFNASDKIILGPDIEDHDFSFAEENKMNGILYAVGQTFARDFTYDLKIDVSANDSLILEGLTATQNAGADGLFETGDDSYSYNSGPRIELWNGTYYDTARLIQGSGTFNPLEGTQYADNLVGTSLGETLEGHGGNDVINAGDGNDVLRGGTGQDVLHGQDGHDDLYGGLNVDTLNGGDGEDDLYGNEGNDILNGGNDNDRLYGENGDDILNGGAGNDQLYGHFGDDDYRFSSGFGSANGEDVVTEQQDEGIDQISFDYTVNLSELTYWMDDYDLVMQIGTNVDNQIRVAGSGTNETGSDFADRLEHVVFSDGTWDLTQGGFVFLDNGLDDFYGSNLNDTINAVDSSLSYYRIYGGLGDDIITGVSNDVGHDYLFGGSGNDIIYGGDNHSSHEYYVWGEDGDDVIYGGSTHSYTYEIKGGNGNDTIYGANLTDGDMKIYGNHGDDVIYAGDNEGRYYEYTLQGGEGLDTYVLDATSFLEIEDVEDGNLNIIHFESGITPSDLYFYGDDDYLEIRIGSENSQYRVRIQEPDTEPNDSILNIASTFEKITFEDSLTEISLNSGLDLIGRYGTQYNDNFDQVSNAIYSSPGDDVYSGIDSNAGVDYEDDPGKVIVNLSSSSQTYGANTILESRASDGYGDQDTLNQIYDIDGSNYNDLLWGSSGRNTIYAGAGDDVLFGLGDFDRLYGGAGNDVIYGGDEGDNLYGDDGDDILYGGDETSGNEGTDGLLGGAGNDILDGGIGNTNFYGGAGNDTFIGDETARFNRLMYDYFDGPSGIIANLTNVQKTYNGITLNPYSAVDGYGDIDSFTNLTFEEVRGGAYNDVIYSGAANTNLGASFNTRLSGNEGDDIYIISQNYGNLLIHESENEGFDTLLFDHTIQFSDVTFRSDSRDLYAQISGSSYDILIFGDTTSSGALDIENIFEQIAFDDGNGYLDANDQVVDLTGGLILNANGGSNKGTIYSDHITGSNGGETINGYEGNDILIGGGGNDTLRGGDGTDTVQFSGMYTDYIITDNGSYISVQDTAGSDGTDKLYDIEFLKFFDGIYDGTLFTSTLFTGTSNSEILTGTIYDDTLEALDGNDILIGGSGNDSLNGGVGNDSADYSADVSGVMVDLESGSSIDGWGNTDTLSFIENVIGSGFNDTITGDDQNNTLTGGLGDDSYLIQAGGGDDVIIDAGGVVDSIRFSSDIAASDLSYSQSGHDLIIAVAPSGFAASGVTIRDHFTYGGHIESLIFDNGDPALSLIEVLTTGSDIHIASTSTSPIALESNIVDGMADNDFIYGIDADDILYGGAGNDKLYGQAGNDSHIGGAGDDFMFGAQGDDKYYFGLGDGADDLKENASDGNDTLYIAGGIVASDVYAYALSDREYTIELSDSSKIRIESFANTNGATNIVERVENIVFDDGTTWNIASGITVQAKDITETLYGSDLDDTIDASGGDDIVNAAGGDDYIEGGLGDDTLDGGTGVDTIYGGDGIDDISGRAGDDVLYGEDGNDIVNGHAGNDILYGGAGVDVMLGGDDNDTLYGGLDDDSLQGQAGDDILFGEEGNDNLYAQAGNDTLYGGAGNDDLFGYEGNDTLDGGIGNDILDGAEDDDVYIFTSSYGTDEIREQALEGTDTLRITGGILASEVYAYAGADRLYTIELADGSLMKINSYSNANGVTNVVDRLENIEFDDGTIWNIGSGIVAQGKDIAETFYGSDLDDTLSGNGGDDVLYGGLGLDTLNGGTGVDALNGGDSNDTLNGGAGGDTLKGDAGDDILNGGDDVDILWGGAGADTLNGDAGNDFAYAGNGDDILNGGTGNDLLSGENDNDALYGDAGDDKLYGGAGTDTLYGGDGLDHLYGQAGADTFVFEAASAYNNVDLIRDFSTTDNDAINIANLLGAYDPLNDVITDFVQITEDVTHSYLSIDADGGSDNFIQIARIENITGLTDEAQLVTDGTLVV